MGPHDQFLQDASKPRIEHPCLTRKQTTMMVASLLLYRVPLNAGYTAIEPARFLGDREPSPAIVELVEHRPTPEERQHWRG